MRQTLSDDKFYVISNEEVKMKKSATDAALCFAVLSLLWAAGCFNDSSGKSPAKKTVENRIIEIPVGVAK